MSRGTHRPQSPILLRHGAAYITVRCHADALASFEVMPFLPVTVSVVLLGAHGLVSETLRAQVAR